MRKPQVTRKIRQTAVRYVINSSGKPEVHATLLIGVLTDEKKILEKVREKFPDVEIVGVMEHKVIEKLYGMAEADFLQHAKELDPKTRKALN